MKSSAILVLLAAAMALAPVAAVDAKGSRGGGSYASSSGSKSSSTAVHSYTKKNGTHVDAHRRTTADRTEKNNYSARGNSNPNTGKTGHKTPKR